MKERLKTFLAEAIASTLTIIINESIVCPSFYTCIGRDSKTRANNPVITNKTIDVSEFHDIDSISGGRDTATKIFFSNAGQWRDRPL